MTNHDDWYKQQERLVALAAQLRIGTKTQLFDALAAAGIATVTVDFDGAGDSGQIADIAALDPANERIELPLRQLTVTTAKSDGSGADTATLPLKDAIENLCYELLDEHHGGWDIDDGSFGAFELDIAARSVALTFNSRITETSTHRY